MANPNKFNDPAEGGNIYGEMIKNPSDIGHNGRTPVNPAAESMVPKQSVKQDGSFKTTNVTPSQA